MVTDRGVAGPNRAVGDQTPYLRRPAGSVPRVLVVTRFRVPADDPAAVAEFRAGMETAMSTLAAQPGHLSGLLGRNLDDPDLWVLTTRWESVGAYRRGVSSHDAKMYAWPVLTRALDEPSAYEPVLPGTPLNTDVPRETG